MATAFCDLAQKSNFWLGMDRSLLGESIRKLSTFKDSYLSLEELERLSGIFAFIIDSRSRFTASHSTGVATVAHGLAAAHGLDEETCLKLKIAGYLHDIGKVSVPQEILEKNGSLTEKERLIMTGHSFYTHKIIHDVRGFDDIGKWAANHHEFVDGSGYPFGLKGEELDTEARIMTVADIFTALTETRPYRQSMETAEAIKVLEDLSKKGKIDETVLSTLTQNAAEIDKVRKHAQDLENQRLDALWKSVAEHLKRDDT